jgi:hypothetical protein
MGSDMLERMILIIIIVIGSLPANSAEKETDAKKSLFLKAWRFSGEAGSHNVTWPFLIWHKVHPALDVAADTPYYRWKYGEFPLRARLGGFFDRDFNVNGFLLDIETGHRFTAPFGLFGELCLFAGYLGTRDDRPAFEQTRDGAWRETPNDVRSSLAGGASITIGYDFDKLLFPMELFFRYRWFVQYPYAPPDYPIMGHGIWSAGVAFKLAPRGEAG